MINENTKKWVEALRSGDYKQGFGYLAKKEAGSDWKYCCLGVACELYINDPNTPDDMKGQIEGSAEQVQYKRYVVGKENSMASLLSPVKYWLGLASHDGIYTVTDDGAYYSLADRNDSGKTFAEIADIIESEPERLFVT